MDSDVTQRDKADQRAHRNYLRDKYVQIRQRTEPFNMYTVWLKVGPQEFSITPEYMTNQIEARYVNR